MDIKDLRKKNIAELQSEILEKSKSLSDFKFGKSKTKNTKEGKNLKREIAQAHTIINEMKKTAK